MKVLNGQNKSLHEIDFIYMLSNGIGKCVCSELAVGSFVYCLHPMEIHLSSMLKPIVHEQTQKGKYYAI